MAKGKSRSGTRDPLEIATRRVRSRLPTQTLLTTIEDMRAFDFEPGTRPARLFSGSTASIGVSDAPKSKNGRSRVPYQVAFKAPAETLVCVRRARRKQVLHALRKTGRGGQRRPRRSKWSSIKCGPR